MQEKTNFLPTGVIFDSDGLMLDTERLILNSWIKLGKLSGWDIGHELFIHTIGLNEIDTRETFLEKLGQDFPYDRLYERFLQLVDEEYEKGIPHRPGLITLLDHLAYRKIPLAVATSADRDVAIRKLSKAGILERFTAVVCGDEIANGKPAPDIFLLAAEKLGQDPSSCVGFEDSPAGLRGLHAAGIRSVFVKDLIDIPPDLKESVWRCCEDLAQAVNLFNG